MVVFLFVVVVDVVVLVLLVVVVVAEIIKNYVFRILCFSIQNKFSLRE